MSGTQSMTLEDRLARAEREVAELKAALQMILAIITATEGGEDR